MMTTTPNPRAFTVDGAAGTWQAVRFGQRWNGWLTPVVERATLQSLIDAASGVELAWEGSTAIVICEDYPDEPDRLRVAADGLYDLVSLGWCFTETDRWDRPVVQCGYCGRGGYDVAVIALHQRISPHTAICCDAGDDERVPA